MATEADSAPSIPARDGAPGGYKVTERTEVKKTVPSPYPVSASFREPFGPLPNTLQSTFSRTFPRPPGSERVVEQLLEHNDRLISALIQTNHDLTRMCERLALSEQIHCEQRERTQGDLQELNRMLQTCGGQKRDGK